VEQQSDSTGAVSFPNLRYVGKGQQYRLAVCAENHVIGWSGVFSYDPIAAFDRSYVVVSAIKTLSGQAPPNEFFDVRLRLLLGQYLAATGNFDLSLSSRDTNNAGSQSPIIPPDATGQLHFQIQRLRFRSGVSDIPQRAISFGLASKVMSSFPYWGFHISMTELGGSPFHGSSVSFGWLNRTTKAPQIIHDTTTAIASTDNLYWDFFIRSSRIEFFKYLTVRGGFFLPLTGTDRQLRSRIAIAVPIGDVNSF
jgi:hypothetical protein